MVSVRLASGDGPPPAGALGKVRAHLDYVERARRVVAIPTDVPVPDGLDLSRPRTPPDEETRQAAERHGLAGALDRLAAALTGGRSTG
jgi:hypothetical protein